MSDSEYDESKGTLPDMNIFSQVLKDSFAPANIVQSLVNKYTDAGTTGRDVALNDMNRQNVVDQASLEVEGYKKAGLNPALMYGSGTNSAPQSSGAPSGGSLQELVALATLPMQLKQMQANINATNAQAENIDLDNTFLRLTMDSRTQSTDLVNKLTAEQIKEVIDNRGLIAQNIKKAAAETENEHEKNLLIKAQTAVENANAEQIVALLPYHKELMAAQTDSQKAKAVLDFWSAAYQEKLVNSDYIDAMIDGMRASAVQAYSGAQLNRVMSDINQFRSDVQSGVVFKENSITSGNTAIGRAINFHANIPVKIVNGIMRLSSSVSTAIAGPLSGLLGK